MHESKRQAFIGQELSNEWGCGTATTQQAERQNLVDLIIGHSQVNHHRYKTIRAHSSDCKFCLIEDERTRHILKLRGAG